MLTLTENATAIVKTITEQPDANALRIAGSEQPESFAISTADEPEAEDQVLEQDGAKLYLDAAAAQQLDDKVLDAGVDEAGNVQFGLTLQQG